MSATARKPAKRVRAGLRPVALDLDGVPTTVHTALIPARRHSSRCPDKNWRLFADGGGLTDRVLESLPDGLFSSVILSTDHDAYEPPVACRVHRRDPSLATDHACVQDLVRVVIDEYDLHDAYIWLLNPTSPFRDAEDFARIDELIRHTSCPSVISVTPAGPFLWQGDRPLFSTTGPRARTQDADTTYYTENGMFYVFLARDFLEHGTWYLPGMRRYVQHGLDKAVDIDTPDDFHKAQAIAAALPATTAMRTDETVRNETLAIERLVAAPVAPHLQLLDRHLERYRDAATALRLDGCHRVLDASCGKGYGSYLLAQRSREVVGLDVDDDYLAVARREFVVDNLAFMTYDAYFAEPRPRVDKVACIETYEHLARPDGADLLDRLLGALRPGGDLFLTCPLGDDAPSTVNAFHLNEPRLASLHALLSPRFRGSTYRIVELTDSFGRTTPYCCATLTDLEGDPRP